jgi:hypothetical protein
MGETAVIVASGPSTERVDLDAIRGLKTIAIAHGYRAAPDADVLIIGGMAFYAKNDLREFRGPLVVATARIFNFGRLPRDPRLVCMPRDGGLGLSESRTHLRGSESSVMFGIDYAVKRGARRIILLGCDGKPGADGRRHVNAKDCEGPAAAQRYRAQERCMETQIEPLRGLGVEIWNCSPGTALTIYPKAELSCVVKKT